MTAAVVAADGYRAMMKGKTVCVSGFGNSVLGFLAHHSPRGISTRVAHRIQRRLLL